MKVRLIFSFYFGSLLASTANASVVLYEEGVQPKAYSIEATTNGEEEKIAIRDCPANQTVDHPENCTFLKAVTHVSELKDFVRETALRFARDYPNQFLLPFQMSDLNGIVKATDTLANLPNQQALLDLPVFSTKLNNVKLLLQHAPDSTFYQQDQKTLQNQVDYLFTIQSRMDEAKRVLATAGISIDQVTQAILTLLKDTDNTAAPNMLKANDLQHQLMLAVLHRLGRKPSQAILTPNRIVNVKTVYGDVGIVTSAYSTLIMRYRDGDDSSFVGRMTSDPLALTTESRECIFVAINTENGVILHEFQDPGYKNYLTEYQNVHHFTNLRSFTYQNHSLKIIAQTANGDLYEKEIPVDGRREAYVGDSEFAWRMIF